MRILRLNQPTVFWGMVLLLLGYLLVVKLIAASQLSFIGDEADDFGLIARDLAQAPVFFEDVLSSNQARLPHLVSLPLVAIFGYASLLPARLLFIAFHVLYLAVFYLTMKLKFPAKQALYLVIVVGLSSYLFSFSLFTMTTSNNLYLLLSMFALYYYMRFFEGWKHERTVQRLFALGVIFGLAIAAKLFAIFILGSIFIYDLYVHRTKRAKRKGHLRSLALHRMNIIFTLGWLSVNLLPVAGTLKLAVLAGLAAAYIVSGVITMNGGDDSFSRFAAIKQWFLVAHTAFNVTVVASPIYLNARNILGILGWFGEWNNNGQVVNPEPFDTLRIIAVKFGLVAFGLTIVSLAVLWRQGRLRKALGDNALFMVLVLVHLAIFSAQTFVLVWYPLFIFPFLYIPLSYLVSQAATRRKTAAAVLVTLALCVFPAYEHWRYIRLFPYAHTDGAQHGLENVGWNKPGFVTFEGLPLLAQYLKESNGSLPAGPITCFVVGSQRYNDWAVSVANEYLERQGIDGFYCVSPRDEVSSPYFATTVYSPDNVLQQVAAKYKKQKEFIVNTVPVVTLWAQ